MGLGKSPCQQNMAANPKCFVGFLFLLQLFSVLAAATFSANDTYVLWNKIVSKHVYVGQLDGIELHVVDYGAIKDDLSFNTYFEALNATNISGFGKNETYAFFMNAYNALAIRMIIEHPCKKSAILRKCEPITSIWDIGSVLHPVWTMPAGEIAGKMYSLNDIEDYLRKPEPFLEDPRLHSCIVCASISCPNVAMTAFTPWNLNEQMTNQMKDFLSNTKKGASLDNSTSTLTLSKIFFWYSADFDKEGGVLKFLPPYLPNDIAAFIQTHTVTLDYFSYNWSVNGKPPCVCPP